MKRLNIRPVRRKAYKTTTNPNHGYSVAPNLLHQKFDFQKPNQAWVGDITCILTGEAWLSPQGFASRFHDVA